MGTKIVKFTLIAPKKNPDSSNIFKYNTSDNINSTATFDNTVSKKMLFSDIVVIFPACRGMKGENLIFKIQFLDSSISVFDFTYLWSINEFNKEESEIYLNGRHEYDLRLKNSYLRDGENNISLKILDKDSSTVFAKSYTFRKSASHYDGSCIVNPSSGESLVTKISFIFSGWKSDREPLTYKVYASLRGRVSNITLTDDFIGESSFETTVTPISNSFYLDVMDSEGLITTTNCPLTVRSKQISSENDEVHLEQLLGTIFEEKEKLTAIESYNSNKLKSSDDSKIALLTLS